MKSYIGTLLAIVTIALGTSSFAAEDHLTDQQKLGRRLFEQSCGVCHTRPTLISGMYGPELSSLNLGGRDDLLRTFISNGTARMPGFKYTYDPEQIAAIAAYVRTLPPGNQDIPTAPSQARAPTPAQ
jgi:mono/diheme cytochrome c family protein